jgi:hypothetical protein
VSYISWIFGLHRFISEAICGGMSFCWKEKKLPSETIIQGSECNFSSHNRSISKKATQEMFNFRAFGSTFVIPENYEKEQ